MPHPLTFCACVSGLLPRELMNSSGEGCELHIMLIQTLINLVIYVSNVQIFHDSYSLQHIGLKRVLLNCLFSTIDIKCHSVFNITNSLF